MDSIGMRIKKIRKQEGLTQVEFSKSLRISQSHLSGIEKGRFQPSGSVILLISILFNVSEAWLISGSK